jgi:deoxyuridine 5'-triphosphate nucleotidohydrolase
MSTLSPYLLGCLVNFSVCGEDDANGCFTVHDAYAKLHHLYRVHDLYKQTLTGRTLVDAAEQSRVPSRVRYGSPNYFNCTLGAVVRSHGFFPFLLEADNWTYLTGIVDMTSELKFDHGDLRLTIFSGSVELLRAILEFTRIPGIIDGEKLSFTFTNVLDLLGKLPDSIRQSELIANLTGKSVLPQCAVFRLLPGAIAPSKARFSDVGYDLSVIRKIQDLNDTTALYDTGIALRIPFRHYVEIHPRSSLSKTGYMLANGVGIIDRAYTGTLKIALTRVARDAIDLEAALPFRCCQLIFRLQTFVELVEPGVETEALVDLAQNARNTLATTTRSDGGFGSTG